MTASALASAIYALAPSGVNLHRGQAVGTVDAPLTLPWLVVNQGLPDVPERSLASTPQAYVGTVLLTVAATSEQSALWLLDRALAAYEGARPTVAGWLVSPLEQVGDVKLFTDDVVVANVNRRVVVGKATLRYTATRTA